MTLREFRGVDIVLLLLLVVPVAGCEKLWNAGNRAGLNRHIVEVFAKQGVVIASPACNMVGTTRQAVCTAQIPASQMGRAIEGLKLRESPDLVAFERLQGRLERGELMETPDLEKLDQLMTASSTMVLQSPCRSTPTFTDLSQVKAYIAQPKSSELRLNDGSVFSHLLLFQRLGTDDVCIDVSYAYG